MFRTSFVRVSYLKHVQLTRIPICINVHTCWVATTSVAPACLEGIGNFEGSNRRREEGSSLRRIQGSSFRYSASATASAPGLPASICNEARLYFSGFATASMTTPCNEECAHRLGFFLEHQTCDKTGMFPCCASIRSD